ncbi:MAG: hypothetical protein AAF608_10295 [Pseudomonadota bacterium]
MAFAAVRYWATLIAALACLQGTASAWERVATIVSLPRPTALSDDALLAAFQDAAPIYRGVSGLERKSFLYTDDMFGGAYLWTDRAAARAFFDGAWEERMRATYGALPDVTWLKAPVVTPGAGFGGAGDDAVVVTVLAQAPWYAPGFVIRRRMRDSLPLYTDLDQLDFKIFIIANKGRVGGIYLWHDQQAAATFYDEAWRTRIVDTYGEDAEVRTYRAPLTIVNGEAGP